MHSGAYPYGTTTYSAQSWVFDGTRRTVEAQKYRGYAGHGSRLRRIPLPRTSVNRARRRSETGGFGTPENADTSKEKGHKVGAASRLETPPRFGSVTLRLLRSVLRKSGP